MNRAPNSDRRCKVCGARLSSYNQDILCYPCQEKEAEEAFGIAKYKLAANISFFNSVGKEINASR